MAKVCNISSHEYHAHPALNRSKLHDFMQSPYLYHYNHVAKLAEPKKVTDNMLLGTVTHTLVLEPELYDKEFVTLPKLNLTKTKDKETHEQYKLNNPDKTLVRDYIYDEAKCIADSIRKNLTVPILDYTQKEQSIFWTDLETGLELKARPDAWASNYIVDLKTTKDINTRDFQFSCIDSGYYLQAGMLYEAAKATGSPVESIIFLAAENHPPYRIKAFVMDDEAIQRCTDIFYKTLRDLKKCLETNVWLGSFEREALNVPDWFYTKNTGEEN